MDENVGDPSVVQRLSIQPFSGLANVELSVKGLWRAGAVETRYPALVARAFVYWWDQQLLANSISYRKQQRTHTLILGGGQFSSRYSHPSPIPSR